MSGNKKIEQTKPNIGCVPTLMVRKVRPFSYPWVYLQSNSLDRLEFRGVKHQSSIQTGTVLSWSRKISGSCFVLIDKWRLPSNLLVRHPRSPLIHNLGPKWPRPFFTSRVRNTHIMVTTANRVQQRKSVKISRENGALEKLFMDPMRQSI